MHDLVTYRSLGCMHGNSTLPLHQLLSLALQRVTKVGGVGLGARLGGCLGTRLARVHCGSPTLSPAGDTSGDDIQDLVNLKGMSVNT